MGSKKQSKNSGFTLIETTIVLVIIGLIYGSVTKGRDVLYSAKQKNFFSYIKQWELAALSYYDQLGRSVYTIDNYTKYNNLKEELNKYSLNLPSQTYRYAGKIAAETISPSFQEYNGDALYLSKIPTDLALALDVLIDGQSDGTKGQFIRSSNTQWPADILAETYVDAYYMLSLP